MFAFLKTAIEQAVETHDPTSAYWQARRVMASLPAVWEDPHRLVYPFMLEDAEGPSAVTFACTRDFTPCSTVRFSMLVRLLVYRVEHARHEGVIDGMPKLPTPPARRMGSCDGRSRIARPGR